MVGTRLLTKKGGDIKDFFADLKGKAVVVTSGTTSEVLLNKLNEEQKMNMRIISAKITVTLSVPWKAVVPLPL